ncbi:MAG: hypothetical protein H7067_04245 [Burkholderiales bacterium]|nr:hypothetical protein [Opitutaceae bacterium]
MKPLASTFSLLLLSVVSAFSQVQIPVGSLSTNQTFAVRSGSTFAASSLDAYEGKILVVMMMTPWCPYCQSNAIAVGDGILDHFNASSRGALRGENDQGVEIASLLLSTEPASNWDTNNNSFSTANGYQRWGLDASPTRSNPRVLLGYYRGGFIASSNLYDWGEDRRRVVVLNLVKNSPRHGYRQILINQNAFTSSNFTSARAAINAVRSAPSLLTFSGWASDRSLPAASNGVQHDPDRDGLSNLQEFLHGTDPLTPTSEGVRLDNQGGSLRLVYNRAKNLGVSVEYLVSTDLMTWSVMSGLTPTVSDAGSVEQISVPLPTVSGGSRFYQLRITQD